MVALTAAIVMVGLIIIFKYTPPHIHIHHTHEVIQQPLETTALNEGVDSGDKVYIDALHTVGAALQDFQGGLPK